MRKRRIPVCCIAFFIITLLASCGSKTSGTRIEMELTDNYSSMDPFVNAKLFYVDENLDELDLDVSFQMEAEQGLLEIADNNTDQVIWSKTWDENVEESTFQISLEKLEKEKEYVIRFTGTKVKYAKIVITSENNLVKDRERPLKTTKDEREPTD